MLPESQLALCVNGVKKWSSELLHDTTRPVSGCLSIVGPSWHHLVVAQSPTHREGTLIRLQDAKTVTPSLLLVLSRRPSEPRFRAFTRPLAASESVFEHCGDVLVPLGSSPVAHLPRGHAGPTPGREHRYTKPPSGAVSTSKRATL